MEAQSGAASGAITRHHLEARQERKPPGSTLTAVSTDVTGMQAMYMDVQRGAAETIIPTNEDIRVKATGSWVEVIVDATSLRQDLGLPLHDLFENGAYYVCDHSENLGADADSTDNGASAEPQLE